MFFGVLMPRDDTLNAEDPYEEMYWTDHELEKFKRWIDKQLGSSKDPHEGCCSEAKRAYPEEN